MPPLLGGITLPPPEGVGGVGLGMLFGLSGSVGKGVMGDPGGGTGVSGSIKKGAGANVGNISSFSSPFVGVSGVTTVFSVGWGVSGARVVSTVGEAVRTPVIGGRVNVTVGDNVDTRLLFGAGVSIWA